MKLTRIASSIAGVCEGEHFVEFYQDDGWLIRSLTSFVGAGIQYGEPCVVVAVEEHRQELDAALMGRGIDVAAARRAGLYVTLNASETLAVINTDSGMPDRDRFVTLFDPILSQAVRHNQHIRVFGEMVMLLWAREQRIGAVALERLWNDMLRRYPATLFCAYPAHFFTESLHTEMLKEVGSLHSSAITMPLGPLAQSLS